MAVCAHVVTWTFNSLLPLGIRQSMGTKHRYKSWRQPAHRTIPKPPLNGRPTPFQWTLDQRCFIHHFAAQHKSDQTPAFAPTTRNRPGLTFFMLHTCWTMTTTRTPDAAAGRPSLTDSCRLKVVRRLPQDWMGQKPSYPTTLYDQATVKFNAEL